MTTTRITLALACLCAMASLTLRASPGEAPRLEPAFFSILRSGQADELRQALDEGASAQARDAAGNTSLILAAAYGGTDAIQLLIDRGAEINATNKAGATALMRAATDPEEVALLLKAGADVNARSGLGNTVLILAARAFHSERVLGLLLKRGADAKATNNWGATALMAAAAAGDPDSVKLLIEHGAPVNAQPTADQLGFILGGGRTALMWAAFRGDLGVLKMLIDAGADVNLPAALGTPLTQACWADHADAARLLIERGANVNLAGPRDGYAPLHWAASTERNDPALVNLLLRNGADANRGGGENVDAFMGTVQTPLMLARRRGESAVLSALVSAGATNATPDRVADPAPPARPLSGQVTSELLRAAISQAVPPLQKTSLESKSAFLRHASKQDCTSCHQQHLPMTAIALARKDRVRVDTAAEEQLIQMVKAGELKNPEIDWESLFHPDPVQTKGYTLFALAAEDVAADEMTDSSVHHLAAIQGKDGQWYNNLPRPPLQTSDVSATALAVHALQQYPLPGRKEQFAQQVDRARHWLWTVKPNNSEERVYQLLGLAWAGESANNLEPLAQALIGQQRADGGWSQLPGIKSDSFATGQSVYALRVAGQLARSNPAVERGLLFLVRTQLEDGTWFVRRRAFPFQPTMNSGFPHGRDSWISSAATSWAVMALSLPDNPKTVALRK